MLPYHSELIPRILYYGIVGSPSLPLQAWALGVVRGPDLLAPGVLSALDGLGELGWSARS